MVFLGLKNLIIYHFCNSESPKHGIKNAYIVVLVGVYELCKCGFFVTSRGCFTFENVRQLIENLIGRSSGFQFF